jgi:hypothetical protein
LNEVLIVNNASNQVSELFGGNAELGNLWHYVQSMSPETIAQLSKPGSSEVFQVMERNVVGLLGTLPSEHFDVEISTNRTNLGRLLVSAMVSGYFLRNAEQRLNFEKSLQVTETDSATPQ